MSISDCQQRAEELSCHVMSYLSKNQLLADFQHQSYLTNDPSCFRYQDLADRGEEHSLQKNLGIARNICFEKTPDFQNGDWQSTFPPMTVRTPTFYEQWTRAKNTKLQCQSTERPKCFSEFSPERFPGPCGFSFPR